MVRFASLVLIAVLAAPAGAAADVLKIYGEAHGGGMYGQGISGDHAGNSFFQRARGGAYGAAIGAQFLIFDGQIHHRQYVGSEGLKTWTQLTAGFNFGFDTGTAQEKKEHRGGYAALGVGLAFGVGTGAQVELPLDNSEITDKGFFVQARLGFGKHLNKVFDVGLVFPMSYGYLFKSGSGATANMAESQYQSLQIDALLVLRVNIAFI